MSEAAGATLTLPEEDVYSEFCKREWCDGLPFIPPTPERVRAMLVDHANNPALVWTEPWNAEQLQGA